MRCTHTDKLFIECLIEIERLVNVDLNQEPINKKSRRNEVRRGIKTTYRELHRVDT